jgi:hypothetical protein
METDFVGRVDGLHPSPCSLPLRRGEGVAVVICLPGSKGIANLKSRGPVGRDWLSWLPLTFSRRSRRRAMSKIPMSSAKSGSAANREAEVGRGLLRNCAFRSILFGNHLLSSSDRLRSIWRPTSSDVWMVCTPLPALCPSEGERVSRSKIVYQVRHAYRAASPLVRSVVIGCHGSSP